MNCHFHTCSGKLIFFPNFYSFCNLCFACSQQKWSVGSDFDEQMIKSLDPGAKFFIVFDCTRRILKFQSLPVSNITGNNCGGVPTVTSAMLTKISYLYLMHSHSFGQNLWYFQRTLYTFVVTDSEKSIVGRNEVRLCYWTEGTKKSGKKSNSIF